MTTTLTTTTLTTTTLTTTTAPTSPTTPTTIPGRAGELLARLGSRAVTGDLYAEAGAQVYHDVAGRSTHEVRELTGLVRTLPGDVLDLAAGSGRLTMPLLALGRRVTALDLSPYMLRLLEDRLAAAPAALRERCTVVEADMSAFALGRAFPVIVLGTTSVSLLDERGRTGLYRAVRRHLAPGGRFLLSTVGMDTDSGQPAEAELVVEAEAGRAYRMFEHWAVGDSARTVTVFPARIPDDDSPVQVTTTSVGVLPAALLEAELAAAGLTVRARHPLPAVGSRHHDVLLETEVTP
ncbi:daptide-type RiPP biosynthesis methyltransferase [Streptomyces bottropensis]|uniref:daptide-type RiPP biosynthesis methyltransferase n=1 Tax=Streptomyces bottropensis TaxID=42235 RepID=UPI0036D0FF8F